MCCLCDTAMPPTTTQAFTTTTRPMTSAPGESTSHNHTATCAFGVKSNVKVGVFFHFAVLVQSVASKVEVRVNVSVKVRKEWHCVTVVLVWY